MENENKPQQQSKFGYWLKTSITARMLTVGTLVLILLIPLSFINSLITERSFRQQDVVDEINEKWGNEVLVYGPILKIPYNSYSETKTYNEKTKTYYTETQTHINYAYIFPEELKADAKVKSKPLKRGNFESAVYTSDMTFTGNYSIPNLEQKDIKDEDINWEKATIIIKTSNLKGIKNEIKIKLNQNTYAFETNFYDNSNNYSGGLDELESSFISKTDLPLTNISSFNIDMTFNGSKNIKIIPIGKNHNHAHDL